MPIKSREYHKRELLRGSNTLFWTYKHVLTVAEDYQEYHPELAAQALAILDALVKVNEAIEALNEQI